MSRFLVLAAILGCGSSPPEPPPTARRVAAALVAAIDAASRESAPWRCGGDTPGLPAASYTVGKRTWDVAERTLSTRGETIEIGFVADAAGNPAALSRLRARMKVDLVVALGGMGTTRGELDAALAALAGDVPIVALPGDLEDAAALAGAVAAQAGKAPVLDGRLLRRIELGNATIAILAGTSAASRLVAGTEGCVHRAEDIATMFSELSPRPGLRVLASFEAPRVRVEGEPAGNRALVAAAAQQLDVVVHGPVAPSVSSARTGGRDGLAVALSPGTTDPSTRIPRVTPSAGVLSIANKTWRWTPLSDETPR